MEIYHTETQEDYDALMAKLENRGITWWTGKKATKSSCLFSRTASLIKNLGIFFCKISHFERLFIFL